jgi:alpha-galactosidase
MVLGADEAKHFATQIVSHRDGLTARQHLEGTHIVAGAVLTLDTFWLGCATTDPLSLLERFADRMGRAHASRIVEAPCGWGSWGHWLERIDRSLIRETVQALDGLRAFRAAVRVIQIDDGWSEMLDSGRVSSSWKPNRRFPSGIAPLAHEIRQTGRDCGLWLLPFTVNDGSALVRQNPEWLVQDGDGQPFRVGGGDSYCLDPTHPEAGAWLRDLFMRIRDWDVRYVKLDFLRTLLCPDPGQHDDDFDVVRRYARASSRVEAYRAGLLLIRETLGDDAIIVGCSAPSAPGAGLVSTHRVGPDIDPRWSGPMAGVRDAARSLIANWFWHGRTWVNDPDYLIICETETETRFWVTVVAMSGGAVVLSADLVALKAWEARYLALATPPLGRAATPVDLFARGMDARLLVLRLERGAESWSMVAVLNWAATPKVDSIPLHDLRLDARPHHVWDVWRARHRIANERLDAVLDSHDAALFRLTPVEDRPQVVGTEIHWAQGWVELLAPEWHSTALTLTVACCGSAPRGGAVWIWWPTGLCPSVAVADDGDVMRIELRPGEVRVLTFVAAVGIGG